jgi:hypothetical protein
MRAEEVRWDGSGTETVRGVHEMRAEEARWDGSGTQTVRGVHFFIERGIRARNGLHASCK